MSIGHTRFQFRLRTLMFLVAATAIILATACWFHGANQRQWVALQEIQASAVPFKIPDDIGNDNLYPLVAEQPEVKVEWTVYRPFGLPVGSLGRHYIIVSKLEIAGDAPAWVALNRLGDFPSLVEVDIDGNTASDKLLVGLRKLQRLKRLRIASSSMDGSFLESLSERTNLVSLDLASLALRDRAVLQACRFESLEKLYLSGLKITDPASLRGLSKLKKLTRIDLSGRFPNEGLEVLAELKALDTVTLASDSLNNDGVSRVAGSSTIFALDIYGPNVDDEIIDRLAEMPELNMVVLHSTKVTPAGIEKLKRSRPDIDVQADYPLRD